MSTPEPAPRRITQFRDFTVTVSRDALTRFLALARLKQIAIIGGLIAAVLIVMFVPVPHLAQLRAWSESLGPWFVVVFFLIYIGFTQLPIPRTIFTLSAGILFGPVIGIVLVLIATTVSAALSLTVVRHLLGDFMAPHLKHAAVATINERIARRGWLAIISLRMIAAVPFSILNYTAALTSIPVRMFAIATFIGSAPGSIATVLLGDMLTGHTNPLYFLTTVVLFAVGSMGLYIDNKLPLPEAKNKPATGA